jgi:carboxypeptidase family protein/PDZ domain-containing protein
VPRRRLLVAFAALALALVAALVAIVRAVPAAAPASHEAPGAVETDVARAPASRPPAPTAPAPTPPPVTLPPPPPEPPPAAEGAFDGRVVSAATGEGIAGAQLTFARAEEAASTASAADGSFHFAPRAAGRWLLAGAAAPGYLPFAPAWGESPVRLEARAGEVVKGLVVRLAPAVEYDGHVVDAEGRPVAGAEVRIAGEDPSARVVAAPDRWRTGPGGAFHFAAPDGAVLEARREGQGVGRGAVDMAVRATRALTIRLQAASSVLSIAGSVEDAQGAPVEGAIVRASRRRSDAPPATARTDAAGRFRLEGVGEGRWLVTASRPGAAPASDVAEAGASDVRLRLAGGGRVTGRVKDARSGAPVTSFTVAVLSRTPRSVQVAAADGRYELDELPPGRAFVTVTAPGYAAPDEVRVAVPEPGAPAATADFALAPGARLRGVVVERGSGAPVAGARVEAEGGVPDVPGAPVRNEVATDAEGRFELSGLGDGSTTLVASAPGHHARTLSGPALAAGAEASASADVTIELSPLAAGETPRVELAGIGIVAAKRRDALRVASVLPDGGAAEAGLQAGDEIVEIDGVPASRLALDEAVPMLRGPEGTTVTLAIVKGGDAARAPLRVVVPRRLVHGG